MLTLRQLQRLTGLHHITILKLLKNQRKYYLHLKINHISNQDFYSFLKSFNLSPLPNKNHYLFLIFKHKIHYLKNLQKIKDLKQTFPDYKLKLIFLNELTNQKKNKLENLVKDLLTFKFYYIYIIDFTQDKTSFLFINFIKSILTFIHKNTNLTIITKF